MASIVQGTSSWLSTLSNVLGASAASNQQTQAVTKKKKLKTPAAPELAIPDWMSITPTLPQIDITTPDVPTPDPLATVSVSSGEEQRLRRRRKGILASQGTTGNSGGWMP